MTHVLLIPGALLFEQDWARIEPERVAGRFAQRLARARRSTERFQARWCDGAAHLEWLAREFRVPGDPPAAAPFAWQADQGAQAPDELAARTVWLCEPVHLSLQPERSVLTLIDAPPLGAAEVDQLFEEAVEGARGHGAELRRAGAHWYLFPEHSWNIRTTALQAAIGASVEARLPEGPDALAWRRLLNEVQMRWHAHPVNRRRDELGQQTANALWLHGGGRWQPLEASRFARVESDDPVILGWLQAARNGARGAGANDTLTVCPELFEPYWRRDWSAWSQGWARLESRLDSLQPPGASGRVELVACGRHTATTFALDAGWSWRPWRRGSVRDGLLETQA